MIPTATLRPQYNNTDFLRNNTLSISFLNPKYWMINTHLDVFAKASLIMHFKICCNLSSNSFNNFFFLLLLSWSSSPLRSVFSRHSLSSEFSSLFSSKLLSINIFKTSMHFSKVCAMDKTNFTLDWEFVAPIHSK